MRHNVNHCIPTLTTVCLAVMVIFAVACGDGVTTSPSAPIPPSTQSAPGTEVSLAGADLGALPAQALGVLSDSSNGATRLHGFTCSLGDYGFTTKSVSTLSPSGSEVLFCRGTVTVGIEPVNTHIITRQLCHLPLSGTSTSNSQLVVAKSGRVTLECWS